MLLLFIQRENLNKNNWHSQWWGKCVNNAWEWQSDSSEPGESKYALMGSVL